MRRAIDRQPIINLLAALAEIARDADIANASILDHRQHVIFQPPCGGDHHLNLRMGREPVLQDGHKPGIEAGEFIKDAPWQFNLLLGRLIIENAVDV